VAPDKLRAIRTASARGFEGATAMGDVNFRQFQSAARIVLICPDCGHENSEFADVLRGTRFYACRGDGCYYSFDLAGPRQDIGKSLAEACKRFYAAFYTVRGQGFR
jgi:hypothetical protein